MGARRLANSGMRYKVRVQVKKTPETIEDVLAQIGIYVIEDVRLRDKELMRAFLRCMKHAARSVVFAELDHSGKPWDNRPALVQRG
jgi:hypothetical protein